MTTAILLERLDQAILDVIDNPEKTQQTAAIVMFFSTTVQALIPPFGISELIFEKRNNQQRVSLPESIIDWHWDSGWGSYLKNYL